MQISKERLDWLNVISSGAIENLAKFNEGTEKFMVNTILLRSKDRRLYFRNKYIDFRNFKVKIHYLDFDDNRNLRINFENNKSILYKELSFEEKNNIILDKINETLIKDQEFLRQEYLIKECEIEISYAYNKLRNQLLDYVRKLIGEETVTHLKNPITICTQFNEKKEIKLVTNYHFYKTHYVQYDEKDFSTHIEDLKNDSLKELIKALKNVKIQNS